MMEVIVSSLFFAFEALSVVFCIHYLYGGPACFDRITVCFVAADVIWMEIVHFLSLGQIWSLMIYPVIALYCGIKFGFALKVIFVNNILCVVIIGVLQATIMILFGLLFGTQKTEAIDNLFINAIMLIVTVTCLKRCRIKKISDVLQSNDGVVIGTLVTVIISVTMLIFNYKKNKGFDILFYSVLGISIILIIIIAIDIGKHKIKATEAEAELRTHKLYEASFRNLIDDVRARQHEFDNHINAIRSLPLCYKTYDELVAAQGKYCEGIQKENRMNKLLSKGNPAITGFLYTKFLELEKEEIPFSYRIVIGELECEVPVYKMVELLGNLIKNASEAVKERGAGEVHVMMIEEPDRIQIEVSNESDVTDYKKIQQFFKKGYSEKGENRGYGLYNVNKICKDYGIDFAFENRSDEGKNKIVFSMTINKSHQN